MGLKESILSICQKLATIPVTTLDGLVSTLYVRIWNNQIERKQEGQGFIYQTPACFVEVTVTESETLGQGATGHDLTIRFLLEQNNYNTEGSYDEDLDIFALRDKVHQTINGFKPANCSPLVIGAPALDYNHDNTYLCALEYRTHFTDLTASIHDELAGLYVWSTLEDWTLDLDIDLQPDKVGEAPAFVTSPSLTTPAVVGEAVTCSTGSYSGTAPVTVTYQWFVGATEVGDDTDTYTPVLGDYTEDLTCRVTLTNGFGTVSATSAAEVVHSAPVLATSPSITVPGGGAVVGTTLTVVAGTYTGDTPITKTYQWLRNGTAIDGATATTYKLVSADLSASVTCREFAVNAYGDTYADTSAVTALSKPILSVAPEISVSPDATVGNVFSSTAGTWTGTTPITISYQWQRNGADIVGATSSTYTGVLADADAMLSCLVSAANAIDTTQASTSSLYVFTTQYKAVLTEGTAIGATLPSTDQQKLENKIMNGLVQGGAFGGSANTYWFCSSATDASDSFKTINWMNPTGAKFILNGSPLSISNLGFDLDGTDDAITLPINLSAVGYSITNCSIGVYCPPRFLNCKFAGTTSIHLWGASDGTRSALFYNNGGALADWQAMFSNGTTRDTNDIRKAEKNYSVEYDGTNVKVRIGSTVHTFAQASGQTAPSYPLSFGRRNKATPDGYVKGVLSYMYVGNANAPAMINAVLDSVTPSIFPAEPSFSIGNDWDMNVNAKMWQDVSKTVPVANTDLVRVIESNIGSGDLVASADANRGTFNTAIINSLGAVSLDGVNDSYVLPTPVTGDHVFLFVFQNLDNTNGSHLVYGQNYVPVTGTGYVGNPAFGGTYFVIHNSINSGGGIRTKNLVGGFNVIAWKARLISGTTYEWTCVNGLLQANKDLIVGSFSWTEIGKEYLANWQMYGHLARVILCTSIGSDKDLQDLILSLATTYNL